MELYELEKYSTTIDNVKQKLEEYGVAIIPKLLNSIEIKKMNEGMWNTLEHISQNFDVPISRNNSETYKKIYDLYPNHSMLIQHWGIGHSQFIWDLRQNEKIINIFSKIWDVPKDNLLVSFDGASIHMPPEITKRGYFKNNWFHTDQSFNRNEFECVQSWVTGYDVNEGDGTLKFLEKSHLYHDDFINKFRNGIDINKIKKDWYKLENIEQLKFYTKTKKCLEKCIKCPAGSIVLWDSRLIHCGQEPLKERKKHNFRNVVYICMHSREYANDKLLDKRIKAFNEMRMTTHWPVKPFNYKGTIKLFPKNPQTYGKILPNIKPLDKPKINNIGRNLVGYPVIENIKFDQINL